MLQSPKAFVGFFNIMGSTTVDSVAQEAYACINVAGGAVLF